ncbi:ABC transporter permease [Campylobacter sp. MIT 21-1685]|uniref:ABC transporter permease n=1 Tax=unclassified Campylobacter TaxID=2593542 RepID=UPI00224B24F9|nr:MULTISPECIES: ABC transporter permease [unclassified Campylobacter]MCX2682674.1 ABC transporter permease [Campylobacter sp. MIT 21-1684]MCX2750954.1 ABC transporter permease [Campylobacter sp. MIT 21-1682]MCX2807113.1 ABC transporter permease [Campylobacter sp. MIT 21-1685]
MLQRLFYICFIAFFSTFLCFMMLSFSKGSVAFASRTNAVSLEFKQRIEHNLGLDESLLHQYSTWLLKAFKGDFGVSLLSGESVSLLLKEHIGKTFILSFFSLALLFVFSLALALLGYFYRETWLEKCITFLTFSFFALPPFALSLLAILCFGVLWKILPVSGASDIGFENDLFNRFLHLILPSAVLVLSHLALFLRVARTSINESFGHIFTLNLYARGLKESSIYLLVLKHALNPIIAYFGANALSFMMNAYIVESVFSYGGIGTLFVQSILFKDIPVVLCLVFFSVVITSFFTLSADVLCKMINPTLKI